MSPLDANAAVPPPNPPEPRVTQALAEAQARAFPGDPGALMGLGHARRLAGDQVGAVTAFRRAAAMADLAGAAAPLRSRILANLALAHLDRSEDQTALDVARQAIGLDGNCAVAQLNAGVALYRLGEPEAQAHLERAIALDPNDPAPRNTLGLLHHRAGKSKEAEALIRASLARMPGGTADAAPVQANLGRVLRAQGRLEEAYASFDLASRLAPSVAEHRFNRAVIRLLQGRLEEAWDDHEARRDMAEYGREPSLPIPTWTGGPVEGKRILLRAEQGLGDTIQFVRYATLLADRGAIVSLGAPTPLLRVLGTVPGLAAVLPDGATLPQFDLQAMLLSLPWCCRTGLDRVPARVPYLHAEKDLITAWRGRLAELKGLRFGLVWAGNPKHKNDRNRSIDPGLLHRLAGVQGVSWVSLQVGPRGAEAAGSAIGHALFDATAELTDFAETAALLQVLDGVVSVDTSVAHLAGAMGRPVSLLLPWDPDWRWMWEGDRSPWYPTLRIYRQERPRDWAAPISRLATDLAAQAKGRSRHA